ncbi:MAG: FkbM family methyltransferase [Gemmatimonadetes bacterium]|nr:FkbM family methyltransferase [Gemmatimonadota bacterium]
MSGARVAVYGAGNAGRNVSRVLRESGVRVTHFIDVRSAALGELDGIPVLSPAEAHDTALPVVIAVFNRDADPRVIHAVLRGAGAQHVIDYVALHARFARELGDQYWLVAQPALRCHAEAIRKGLDEWHDASSREHYARLLAYRLTGDPSHLPDPVGGVPYRPSDLPQPTGAAHFVDGGAFDGDTARAWLDAGITVERYWGFEPDPANFAALARWWTAFGAAAPTHSLVQAALGAEDGTVRFDSGAGEASRISGEGSGPTVALRALDSALARGTPTEIKLDIEGSEQEALEGARETIGLARPRLATCVYHRPEHLWSIPAWISGLGMGYTLHLRPHAHAGFDVVAYAISPTVRSG